MKKTKRKPVLVLILLVLILACAGGGAFYYVQRQAPVKAVEAFLASVQKMDFKEMEAQLQSMDLTALDNADIRNPVYEEFFKQVNEKLSYEIIKNDFDFQQGSAQVTARLKYIDGSDIYKQTISEFLRQVVSTAFSGDSLTEEETQQQLAALLTEKSKSVEDHFTETEITYPVSKVGSEWKVAALDDETVKIMSANFKSVEDELQASLDSMINEPAQTTPPAAPEEGALIDMTNDRFSIAYTDFRVAKDFSGKPCLMFYYDYTNNSDTPSSAMVDLVLTAYQDGALLNGTVPEEHEQAVDAYMSEIQPGETVNVCQVFSLPGTTDVTLEAKVTFSLSEDSATTQIIKIQ